MKYHYYTHVVILVVCLSASACLADQSVNIPYCIDLPGITGGADNCASASYALHVVISAGSPGKGSSDAYEATYRALAVAEIECASPSVVFPDFNRDDTANDQDLHLLIDELREDCSSKCDLSYDQRVDLEDVLLFLQWWQWTREPDQEEKPSEKEGTEVPIDLRAAKTAEHPPEEQYMPVYATDSP